MSCYHPISDISCKTSQLAELWSQKDPKMANCDAPCYGGTLYRGKAACASHIKAKHPEWAAGSQMW